MESRLALFALLLAATLALAQTAPSPPATAPTTTQATTRPAFTLGKDTTRITSPLLPDGRPDYLTAHDKILSKGVTPENNALIPLFEVYGDDPPIMAPKIRPEVLKRLGVKELVSTVTFQDFETYLKKQGLEYTTRQQEDFDAAQKHPWEDSERPDVARWLAANDKALDLIAKAAARDRYYWPLIANSDRLPMIDMQLPRLSPARHAASALVARAMLRLERGQIKESEADLLATHRLGRLLAHGATLIERVVAIWIEKLASLGDVELAARLDARAAKDYLAELANLPSFPEIAALIDQSERCVTLDAVLSVSTYGKVTLADLIRVTDTEKITPAAASSRADGWDLEGVDWDKSLKQVNGWYDHMVAAMRIPIYVKRKAAMLAVEEEATKFKIDALAATASAERASGWLLGLLLPSFWKARELNDRAQERFDLATLALALAAFHGDHNSYPDQLADLAPNYLKAIPKDIFSDASLIYRKDGPGYLLYSIGPNLKDDGGTPGKDDNSGDLIVKMTK